MPADFSIKAADLKVLLAELKSIDPKLRATLQKEMRDKLKPFANTLKGSAPSESPLSGFRKGVASSTRYTYSTPLASIKTPLGKRAKKPGFYPVVSMSFRGRAKTAGLNIMELAQRGRTPQGNAMVQALNARVPVRGGLGRFIIPEAKKDSGEVTRVAREVIEKYVALVNRRIR
jgi:hypothetical protein